MLNGRRQILAEQMRQWFRVVADKDIENDKRQRDYTYIEREVQNHLDGKGNTKSTEVRTYEILEIYGAQVQRLIEKMASRSTPTSLRKKKRKSRRSSTSARTNRRTIAGSGKKKN